MSRRDNNLSDSLELLLDTMCNTFGGIMFIAISLIIISQLLAQAIKSTSPEEMEESNIQRMSRQAEALQAEIHQLRQQALARSFAAKADSPEQQELLRKMAVATRENLESENRIACIEQKLRETTAQQQRLKSEHETVEARLTQKRATLSADKRKNQARQQQLEQQIAELEAKLQNLHPRELRFGMESATSRAPYWVLLNKNQLYRYGANESRVPGEVSTAQFDFGTKVRMTPLQGTSLGENPKVELDYLFKNVASQKFFISLVADLESFSTLMAAKQYLRDRGFLVNWSVNPDYEFVYSNDVNYKASE